MKPISWLGESGQAENQNYCPSEMLRLPVGILKDGVRYRNIVIEEMIGIDDHNIAGKKSGGNSIVASSLVLCRCIQEVEGLLPRKRNNETMFDRELARAMTQMDRDFVLAHIFMLGGRSEAVMAGECPRCGRILEEEIQLNELEIVEWPDDRPLEVEFSLDVGSAYTDEETKTETYYKDGVLRFPTGRELELMGGIDDPADQITALLTSCIKSLGDIPVIDQERVKRFTSRDRLALMQSIKKDLPGIRMWREIKCRCGRAFDIQMDINAFFGGRRKSIKK